MGSSKFFYNTSSSQKCCSTLVFRDVDGCGMDVEGVMPSIMSVTFVLFCYCMDRVSSCNIYAVQQDTQSVLMSEFIHHVG